MQQDFNYSIKYDWVSLDEISPNMQLAVIAAEDQKFPNHWGFDFEAIQKPLNLMKNLAEPEELQRFLNKQQKPRSLAWTKLGS